MPLQQYERKTVVKEVFKSIGDSLARIMRESFKMNTPKLHHERGRGISHNCNLTIKVKALHQIDPLRKRFFGIESGNEDCKWYVMGFIEMHDSTAKQKNIKP